MAETERIDKSIGSVELRQDELLISAHKAARLSISSFETDALPEIAHEMLRGAASFKNLVESRPPTFVCSGKGAYYDTADFEKYGWTPHSDDNSQFPGLSLDEADIGLYLFQEHYGPALVRFDIDGLNDETFSQLETGNSTIHFYQFSGSEDLFPSANMLTHIFYDGERCNISDIEFFDEEKRLHLFVKSKALGTHILCSSSSYDFDWSKCSFLGCFGLIDVLLVKLGDVDLARSLIDLAAEHAKLTRDFVDLAWAADQLDCSEVVIEALARRATRALREDFRNSSVNIPYIPQLAELYLSKIPALSEIAKELLDQLLREQPDARSLREGADVVKRLLRDPELERRFNELALELSYDAFESETLAQND